MKREPFGILICGLNGCGKTTIGRKLAEKLGFYPMDVENYYFRPEDECYSEPRSREEVLRLLLQDMERHPQFVLSAVKGDLGEEIVRKYHLVIYLTAPWEVRGERIQRRSYDRFGIRVEQGGDLYEQEQAFLRFAKGRTDVHIEKWLETLTCPVLRLDATRPIDEILQQICCYIDEMQTPTVI